ncbi:hypothetical protein FRC11_011518 [Ceratobasidium sp. 423]|nr:hypothetical protein FRC11_011518 [Ceratobasidium sp. 423]
MGANSLQAQRQSFDPGPTAVYKELRSSAHALRKLVSAPDLANEGGQAAKSQTFMSLKVFQNHVAARSTHSSPVAPAPLLPVTAPPGPHPPPVTVHSPPSTVASTCKKKQVRVARNPQQDLDTKAAARTSKSKPQPGWQYISNNETPKAPEDPNELSDDEGRAGPCMRSNTKLRQTATNAPKAPNCSRAMSSTSAVTENPLPLDPGADSSWAAPIMSNDLEFNMFSTDFPFSPICASTPIDPVKPYMRVAGTAVKKGAASSGKGTSAPPEVELSSGTTANPHSGGACNPGQKKAQKQ